ncbi:TonB-dependent receptor [Williamwhitmania taraxaci]|uniref:Outer membrane receptor proteins, mostly Fe transport n=1 Tax=Williamwhitmania taraxaci TaxID=1640674 RepID=A0A1G6N3G8_9BACT|nr:TonB-dependent receptor [Williamwhitmania taraxaci]SDC61967.1 Outer membrane receptor proteins, mostly Fe transport [Williamwhitmania taraxaci]
MKFVSIAIILTLSAVAQVFGQNYVEIRGTVTDTLGRPIPYASVSIEGSSQGSSANGEGSFMLRVPLNKEVVLVVQSLGYERVLIKGIYSESGSNRLKVSLTAQSTKLGEVSIYGQEKRAGNAEMLNPKTVELIPSAGGGFESMLKSIPGVVSNNELSSQYSVRGGSFDENLVYINEVEVYRPFLMRSGQQEGLSAINPDMVASVEFSTGGFDADMGDKMSSALSIRYRKPTEFRSVTSISLLGGTASLEGALAKGRLTYIAGYRYKTSKYLLGSLDTKGEYSPSFSDFQTYLNWDVTSKTSLSVLGCYASNRYEFLPENRETSFGLLNNPLGFKVYYEGQESNTYQNSLTAATITIRPNANLVLKTIGSSYLTNEREAYDILGEYWINELDNSIGSDTYSDSTVNVGVGAFLNHARNSLDAYVFSLEQKGTLALGAGTTQWGIRAQRERVFDNVKEWQMIDSSGYSLPYTGDNLELNSFSRAKNRFDSNRYSGYLLQKYRYRSDVGEFGFTAGVRATYSELNGELNISPRFSIAYSPFEGSPFSMHFSGGVYYQPPFVKELKDASGQMNYDLKSQKSIHWVVGSRYDFTAYDKPFRFTSELYYKQLSSIVPYKMDNIKITYAGLNLASGYTYGIDLKINGELLPGAESWLSLSLLKSEENTADDSYINAEGKTQSIGAYPRPTDQRINLSMFFQDYLANNPTNRVHLTLYYGSGLPFFSDEKDRYDNYFRMPAYRRVDIGFTKVFIDRPSRELTKGAMGYVKSLMVTAEVFNLLDINNTVSYLWVKTVGNQDGLPNMLAIPNYLTSRRFNLRLIAKF